MRTIRKFGVMDGTVERNQGKSHKNIYNAYDKPAPLKVEMAMGRWIKYPRVSGLEGLGSGGDFSPTVFRFGALKPIGFGFPPMDIRNKSIGIKTHVL